MCFIEYNRLVLEEPNIYQNLGDFTRMRVIVFRVLSDCEELVGGIKGDDGIGFKGFITASLHSHTLIRCFHFSRIR